jgi:hypothetical protein
MDAGTYSVVTRKRRLRAPCKAAAWKGHEHSALRTLIDAAYSEKKARPRSVTGVVLSARRLSAKRVALAESTQLCSESTSVGDLANC